MEGIIIRLAAIERRHLTAAARVFASVLKAEPFCYENVSAFKIVGYLDDVFNTPKFCGYACIAEGRAVGFCFGVLTCYFEHTIYDIKEIFISPEFQRGGLGTAFMKALERVLDKAGAEIITITTLRDIPAYKYYQKNGFIESPNTVFMRKRIKNGN